MASKWFLRLEYLDLLIKCPNPKKLGKGREVRPVQYVSSPRKAVKMSTCAYEVDFPFPLTPNPFSLPFHHAVKTFALAPLSANVVSSEVDSKPRYPASNRSLVKILSASNTKTSRGFLVSADCRF